MKSPALIASACGASLLAIALLLVPVRSNAAAVDDCFIEVPIERKPVVRKRVAPKPAPPVLEGAGGSPEASVSAPAPAAPKATPRPRPKRPPPVVAAAPVAPAAAAPGMRRVPVDCAPAATREQRASPIATEDAPRATALPGLSLIEAASRPPADRGAVPDEGTYAAAPAVVGPASAWGLLDDYGPWWSAGPGPGDTLTWPLALGGPSPIVPLDSDPVGTTTVGDPDPPLLVIATSVLEAPGVLTGGLSDNGVVGLPPVPTVPVPGTLVLFALGALATPVARRARAARAGMALRTARPASAPRRSPGSSP